MGIDFPRVRIYRSARRYRASVSNLFAHVEGRGPPVILLHGGVLFGQHTWRAQSPLAQRWQLLTVERAGYGNSAHLSPAEDLDTDAPLVAEMLGDGAHLVGQCSGAVVALLAAALRPDAVTSLTLSEPPVFQLVPESAEAREMRRVLSEHMGAPGDPATWLRAFVRIVGGTLRNEAQLPLPLADGVRALRAMRTLPWEIPLPLDAVAEASFPKLVISGRHSAGFEAVCDALAQRIGARRARVSGARHTTPHTGAAFNEVLEEFLASA